MEIKQESKRCGKKLLIFKSFKWEKLIKDVFEKSWFLCLNWSKGIEKG